MNLQTQCKAYGGRFHVQRRNISCERRCETQTPVCRNCLRNQINVSRCLEASYSCGDPTCDPTRPVVRRLVSDLFSTICSSSTLASISNDDVPPPETQAVRFAQGPGEEALAQRADEPRHQRSRSTTPVDRPEHRRSWGARQSSGGRVCLRPSGKQVILVL